MCRWYLPSLACLLLMVASPGCRSKIGPVQHTATSLSILKQQAEKCWRREGSLPLDLQAVVQEGGWLKAYAVDGWNRPLVVVETPEGGVAIGSLGEDGEVGGTGDSVDRWVAGLVTETADGVVWTEEGGVWPWGEEVRSPGRKR